MMEMVRRMAFIGVPSNEFVLSFPITLKEYFSMSRFDGEVIVQTQ